MLKTLKNLFALAAGCFLAFVLLEVFLRIYNPFHFRVKGERIVLKANFQEFRVNEWTPKLDSLLVHQKNDLGFRGPNTPGNFDDYLSIVAIGGSTTESWYSTKGKGWPAYLAKNLESHFKNFWVNNAGLDGHSTFAHQVLLDDHIAKLKPKVVIFYVGINDMGRTDLNSFDKDAMKENIKGTGNQLIEHSEIINISYNILRSWRAKKHKLGHNLAIDLANEPTLTMSEADIHAFLDKNLPYTASFQARLERLVQTCRAHDIFPVFMTQPVLYGEGVDDLTGADLEGIKVWEEANGKAVWELLQAYNQTAQKVAAENNCGLLDIAGKLPKSSRYYYDLMHYSNEGSAKVGYLAGEALVPILQERFPAYSIQPQETEKSQM